MTSNYQCYVSPLETTNPSQSPQRDSQSPSLGELWHTPSHAPAYTSTYHDQGCSLGTPASSETGLRIKFTTSVPCPQKSQRRMRQSSQFDALLDNLSDASSSGSDSEDLHISGDASYDHQSVTQLQGQFSDS